MKRVGILNSGGDCAGLNAVISSFSRCALANGYEVFGFIKGFEGILDKKYVNLTYEKVRGISHLGGTILQSTNRGRFAAKIGKGDVAEIPEDILSQTKANLDELQIDTLCVIGGDGTLTSALQLQKYGISIVGVPKTMDNDLAMTDKTFGFSTAVDIVTDAVDKINTTMTSHNRIFFIETFGRHAGWVALYAGLAGGVDVILIPEIPFTYNKIVELLRSRKNEGREYAIVLVAEGAKSEKGELITRQSSTSSEVTLGGISQMLMNEINIIAPDEFDMRSTILGHIQRGGSPNSEDRILSKRLGVSAFEAVTTKKFGHMVALRNGEIVFVPIADATNALKMVSRDDVLVQVARKIGISFGD
jgi:ATP-dependent phosphofructokinase / diphosphate-dependent phosphofructokinase